MKGHECYSPGYRGNWYHVQAKSKNKLKKEGENSSTFKTLYWSRLLFSMTLHFKKTTNFFKSSIVVFVKMEPSNYRGSCSLISNFIVETGKDKSWSHDPELCKCLDKKVFCKLCGCVDNLCKNISLVLHNHLLTSCQVRKYFDSNTIFTIFPMWTAAVELKLSNHNMNEV